MRCLWCDQEIVLDLSWTTLLFLRKTSNICKICAEKLEQITGRQCIRCGRMEDKTICDDCRRWKCYYHHNDVLTMNRSIFVYNQMIKEMINRWKYRGDYIVGELFQSYVEHFYSEYKRLLPKQTIIVPIPLSEQRMKERGFNQAKMLADFFPLPQADILGRMHREKQSKKTKQQRLQSKNPFHQVSKLNKTVLLVDDIYTTGTTLRHAAEILKQNGCPQIYAWTLIRG